MYSIILMIFAGIFNACMDVIKVRWNTCVFNKVKNQNWFNPTLAWKNKWKNGDEKLGERFFLSSTSLVFLTDFWHFSKMLMIIFICLAIVFYSTIFIWYIDLIILLLSFTITFELFFKFVLIKNSMAKETGKFFLVYDKTGRMSKPVKLKLSFILENYELDEVNPDSEQTLEDFLEESYIDDSWENESEKIVCHQIID